MCQLGRGSVGRLGPQKLWGKWCKILHSRHFQALKITYGKHDFLYQIITLWNNYYLTQRVRISSIATSILLQRYLNNRSKHFLIDISNKLYFADSILTLSLCNFFVKCCSRRRFGSRKRPPHCKIRNRTWTRTLQKKRIVIKLSGIGHSGLAEFRFKAEKNHVCLIKTS